MFPSSITFPPSSSSSVVSSFAGPISTPIPNAQQAAQNGPPLSSFSTTPTSQPIYSTVHPSAPTTASSATPVQSRTLESALQYMVYQQSYIVEQLHESELLRLRDASKMQHSLMTVNSKLDALLNLKSQQLPSQPSANTQLNPQPPPPRPPVKPSVSSQASNNSSSPSHAVPASQDAEMWRKIKERCHQEEQNGSTNLRQIARDFSVSWGTFYRRYRKDFSEPSSRGPRLFSDPMEDALVCYLEGRAALGAQNFAFILLHLLFCGLILLLCVFDEWLTTCCEFLILCFHFQADLSQRRALSQMLRPFSMR